MLIGSYIIKEKRERKGWFWHKITQQVSIFRIFKFQHSSVTVAFLLLQSGSIIYLTERATTWNWKEVVPDESLRLVLSCRSWFLTSGLTLLTPSTEELNDLEWGVNHSKNMWLMVRPNILSGLVTNSSRRFYCCLVPD